MKQKIRYRITTNMGVWLAWDHLKDANPTDGGSHIIPNKYSATHAMPNDGKYEPLVSTTFNCDHVVEYLREPLLIETRDDTTA